MIYFILNVIHAHYLLGEMGVAHTSLAHLLADFHNYLGKCDCDATLRVGSHIYR